MVAATSPAAAAEHFDECETFEREACLIEEMPTRQFNYPKVVAVKETSAHRKTKVHPVVERSDDQAKAPRERRRPQA